MNGVFKKAACVLMSVALACATAVPALAAEATGAITVTGLPESEATELSAYQLVAYDSESGAWTLTELAQAAIEDETSALATLTSASNSNSADVAAILTAVADYVADNGSVADATATTTADADGSYATSAMLSVTSLGAYLVTASGTDYAYTNMLATNYSSTDGLVDATITAKGTSSGVVKTVDDAEVAVGDTVAYTVSGTFPNFEGTASPSLVVTDTMDESLSLVTAGSELAASDVTVTYVDADGMTQTVSTDSYTLEALESGNGFALTFASTWLAANDTAIAGCTYTLAYSATVTVYDSTNTYTNEVEVSALDNSWSDSVDVYTTGVTLTKTDSSGTALAGVAFTVTTTLDGVTYYVTSSGTLTTTATTLETASDGTIALTGLDPDYSYTITEVETLDGYALSSQSATLSFSEATTDETGTTTYTVSFDAGDATEWSISATSDVATASVTLVNYALGELPTTGDGGMFALVAGGVALMLVCGGAFIALRRRARANG